MVNLKIIRYNFRYNLVIHNILSIILLALYYLFVLILVLLILKLSHVQYDEEHRRTKSQL